jgi:4-amino-4-deoxy-L-arabinose transferase-like glycosyltransferase
MTFSGSGSFATAERRWLTFILAAYLLIGIGYLLATPPLESSDEYKHYPFVQYVQTEGRLPVLYPADPGRWLQEAAQPPLYYIIMAFATAWIDTGDLPEVHRINPHAFIGDPNQVGNKNIILPCTTCEMFPGRGTVLAVNVIRLLSLGIGLGTLLLTALLGRALFNTQIGLLAAALTAFNPMFLFISAAVNNDSLAAFMGVLIIFLLVRIWQTAPDPQTDRRPYVWLGLALGLGILTKLSLGGLLGLAGLSLAVMARQKHKWRYLFMGGVITLLVTMAVSGWWFARNLLVYGEPTGLPAFIAVQGVRENAITWADWVGEFGTFYRSYWGLFGGVNIAAPQPFYYAANLLALLGMIGLIRWWWQRPFPEHGGAWLPALAGGILLLLLLRWTLISPAFQGRLLFPALAALNVLWAAGMMALAPPFWRQRVAWGLAVSWFFVAALLPWYTIRPAYHLPEPLTAVPEIAHFGPISFNDGQGEIRLVGVALSPRQSIRAGGQQPVRLTLYWQSVSPVAKSYLSAIHLLGRDLRSVGQVNRYPAGGMIPTGEWQPGQIWRDVYHVYADEAAVAPARLLVQVSLYDSETGTALPAAGPEGVLIHLLTVGEARLEAQSTTRLEPAMPLEVTFSDGVVLAGYSLDPQTPAPGGTVAIRLYWRATAVPTSDYTVFLHLLDEAGQQIVGADGPPVGGYYPTSWWLPGDWIEDVHLLSLPADLPAGEYQLATGLYEPSSGIRMQRLDGGDTIEWPLPVR